MLNDILTMFLVRVSIRLAGKVNFESVDGIFNAAMKIAEEDQKFKEEVFRFGCYRLASEYHDILLLEKKARSKGDKE